MKQIKRYDNVHLKLENLEENLRIECRNYIRKDDKFLLGWIVRFLNQNYGDYRKFWKIFYKMAERKYLQVFSDYYTSIFLSFLFFDKHITLAKYDV